LLNTKIANSKGYYFFDYAISDDLKKELLLNPNVRDFVSKLRIETWVYDYNLKLINDRPFYSQQEMLRTLNLKRVRTINKYKDAGILFKGYYFFSQEINQDMKNKLTENKLSLASSFAKPTRNAKLLWVYTINDNSLVNNKPFLSIISASKFLNLNRKTITRYIDTNKPLEGYKFFSKTNLIDE
jgi:hypothetical protein